MMCHITIIIYITINKKRVEVKIKKEDISALLIVHYIATGKQAPDKERLSIMVEVWHQDLPESINLERLRELLSLLRRRSSESPSISTILKLHNEIDLKKEGLRLPLTVGSDTDFKEHCIYHAGCYPDTEHGRTMRDYYLGSADSLGMSEWEIKRIGKDYLRRKVFESKEKQGVFA